MDVKMEVSLIYDLIQGEASVAEPLHFYLAMAASAPSYYILSHFLYNEQKVLKMLQQLFI
jgi:hypothetical protein